MRFNEIVELVSSSSSDDWHTKETHTQYGWEWSGSGSNFELIPKTHDMLATFKPNVAISMVFGATLNKEFSEPWTNKFSDAESVVVGLRYHGAVVDDWVSVVVDEGRYLLPMPKKTTDGYQFDQQDKPLAHLLFDLFGSKGTYKTLDEVLEFAGVSIS